MRATARQFAPILMAGMLSTLSAAVAPEDLSLTLLETRLHEIDGQLAQLANYNLGGGVGAIGSRSRGYDTAEQDEWVEIEFGDAVPLDQVVLVPAIRRDGVNGFQADGFPVAFRLRAGASGDRIGKIVGEFTGRAALNPNAIYRDPMTMDDYLNVRMISTPLSLYDLIGTT